MRESEVSPMTDCSKLVERQLRLVEIKRHLERLGQRLPPITVHDVHYGPCVLVSRECGSDGDEVARQIGERLHWHVFDREIVEQIAQRAHVRNQLVESVDEHIRSRWSRLLHPLRERVGIKPETYLFHLHEIVLALGHHGDVVIVGRGAQFLLPAQSAVRVRVVAPFETRVRRVAADRGLAAAEAEDFVQRCDADRAEFSRRSFHQDATSPLNYDLVLNTGDLTVEAAAAAVFAAFEAKLGAQPEAISCATSLKD